MTLSPKYKNILVIDDTGLDRMIAEKMIKIHGFAQSVVAMDSAKNALNYLSTLQDDHNAIPDIIFLDINMPLMNGLQFLSEYEKLHASLRKRSIVVLTSSLNDSDRKEAMESPYVLKYIRKPINAEVLKQL